MIIVRFFILIRKKLQDDFRRLWYNEISKSSLNVYLGNS